MVNRLVVLKLDGDLETTGFQVTLDVAKEGEFTPIAFPQMSQDGHLPANPELAVSLKQWQQDYGALTQSGRSQTSRALTPYKIQVSGSINPLIKVCQESSEALVTLFKEWLRTDSFRDIEMALRETLDQQNAVRVLIRTQSQILHLLPWHLWPFIQDYPNAEIAMGASQFQDARGNESPSKLGAKVNILAVLGNDEKIDIETDGQLLNALPGANIEVLVKPTRQVFHDRLYKKNWDILFFAGHSDTNDGQGIIQLNPSTMLTIAQVEYGVRKAIANGLKLAIFNSCNGMGLASTLTRLHLPQMIVMREALPDHVAHEFLKSFLTAFSKGRSFYQAEREARERLQGMENEFPCASWLPIIYQHPAKTPPSWRSLRYPAELTPLSNYPTAPTLNSISDFIRLTLVSFIITSVVVSLRLIGGWQSLEFWAFNSLAQWKLIESTDSRLLLITIDKEDIDYQDEQGYTRNGSLSNEALAKLLTILQPYSPSVIGIDIFREAPLTANLVQITEDRNVVFICNSDASSGAASTITPPANIPISQVGFSNIASDPDHYIRRHLIGMSPGQDCNTGLSFSYQLARRYLYDQHDIHDQQDDNGVLIIGDRAFPPISHHHGPYHRAKDHMGGHELLLNFRKTQQYTIASTYSLKEILNLGIKSDELDSLVRDRIILVGTKAISFNDYHLIPYGKEKIAGVELQAQMVSQMVSAVLDDRPLLSFLPQWGDGLWIFIWTLGAGGLSIYLHRRYELIVAATLSLSSLSGVCFWALNVGLWLPLIPTAISCTAVMAVLQHQKLVPIPWIEQAS